MPDPAQRAKVALEGLSIGDALGDQFRRPPASDLLFVRRVQEVPDGPWRWTRETAMALAVVEGLCRRGTIDPGDVARSLARRWSEDPARGYRVDDHDVLGAVSRGDVLPADRTPTEWSYGYLAAKRAAPIGAWWSGNLPRAKADAERAARALPARQDDVDAAVAVAVAAAVAFDARTGRDVLEAAEAHTPDGLVRDALRRALALGPTATVWEAMEELGNAWTDPSLPSRGEWPTPPPCPVAFALWSASTSIDDFEAAFWRTATVQGDIVGNCAIVGAVVACKVGLDGIPPDWRTKREPLPWPTL